MTSDPEDLLRAVRAVREPPDNSPPPNHEQVTALAGLLLKTKRTG